MFERHSNTTVFELNEFDLIQAIRKMANHLLDRSIDFPTEELKNQIWDSAMKVQSRLRDMEDWDDEQKFDLMEEMMSWLTSVAPQNYAFKYLIEEGAIRFGYYEDAELNPNGPLKISWWDRVKVKFSSYLGKSVLSEVK